MRKNRPRRTIGRRTAEDYKNQYNRRKYWIDKIKQHKGCVHCGYNEHACALDFDHINPDDKLFLIPRVLGRSRLKRIFAEIRKCQILCANCHRVHSRHQWDNYLTRKKNESVAI